MDSCLIVQNPTTTQINELKCAIDMVGILCVGIQCPANN